MIEEIGVGVLAAGMLAGLCVLFVWLGTEPPQPPHLYDIHCYSKGELVFERQIFGYVDSKYASEGWQFQDAKTNRVTQVTGDCVVDELP